MKTSEQTAANISRQYEETQEALAAERDRADALTAHVEWLKQELRRCASLLHCNFPSTDKDKAHKDAVALLKDKPETSLARLKAKWQAEAIKGLILDMIPMEVDEDVKEFIKSRRDQLRRQAEGGEV